MKIVTPRELELFEHVLGRCVGFMHISGYVSLFQGLVLYTSLCVATGKVCSVLIKEVSLFQR